MEQAAELQVVGQDIPAIHTVFNLKTGARAKLIDRGGSMVIVGVEKRPSDCVEWSGVKDRIASN